MPMGPVVSCYDRRPVNPDMVILGRESRGLSQKSLADELGVTQGRISKIEAGLLPVPDELLESLSAVLRYPAHFFVQEGGITGVGIAEVFHRKRQDVPKKVLDKIHAQMDIRLRHVSELLRSVEIPCELRRLDIDEYDGRVEEIARLVRASWRMPRGPVPDLTLTIEDAGVVVVPIDFKTPRIDAISRWIPGLPPLFFVNQHSPKDRYRFSLAHELGHIIMHALPTPEVEEQADRFAAEFLLPERDVRSDLTDLTLAKLAQLKLYWKTSMAALLKRAEDLGTITTYRARQLWSQMSTAGYKRHEPVELDPGGERPSLLKELIEAHRKELGYSTSDLGEMLALYEDEVESIYLQDGTRTKLKLLRLEQRA